jgi:hypothetical protein
MPAPIPKLRYLSSSSNDNQRNFGGYGPVT